MTAKERSIAGSAVLVTGGCGFMGSALVRALLDRGAARVVALDDLRCGREDALQSDPRLSVSRLSLGAATVDELRALLEGVRLVFHFAAEKAAHPTTSQAGMLRANVQGTHDLLEACTAAGVEKVVYASSVMAYGRRQGPALRESDLPAPDTVYGTSKLAGEHLLRAWARATGGEWNALRYFFVYGPRQFEGSGYRSVILRTGRRLLAGQPPQIYGDGEQTFDYVFIDDAIEAALQAMQRPLSGETLNVGRGEPVRIKHLIQRLVDLSGLAATPEHAPPDATAGTFRVAVVERARELLGWEPEVTLDEGLARTYAWLAEEQQDQP